MESDDDVRERLQRLERKVEFLLRHFALTEQAQHGQQAYGEVLTLKRAGRLIDAIKLYRELTGVGLAEAKAYVDRLQ
jgi:ribosomal protein L7/L12